MPRLTKEQRAQRKHGIGSSEVAELLGISPYADASPVRLFAEKKGLFDALDEEDEEDEEESIQQKVGHALEPALIALYRDETKREVIPQKETIFSKVHPWAFATIDGRIKDLRAALEIKVVGIGMLRGWDAFSDDGIPHYVRTQVAWQMMVEDLDEVHVAALLGGTTFRVFYVKRDRELEALLVESARAFWLDVQNDRAPALDATKATREYLEARHPMPEEVVEIVLDESNPDDASIIAIGTMRADAAKRESEAAKDKGRGDHALLAAMGSRGCTKLYAPGAWTALRYRTKKGTGFRFTDKRGITATDASNEAGADAF
jgi:putative phage-type endonuclease